MVHIDVVDKSAMREHLKDINDNMEKIRTDIRHLRDFAMILRDRIQMLEEKK